MLPLTADSWRRARVLLIGQAPGRAGPPPGRALVGGRSGTFLQNIAGFHGDLKGYIKNCETTNVLKVYPGRVVGGKGDLFPMDQARAAAAEMLPTLVGRRVVMVGYGVADAFRVERSLFQWFIKLGDFGHFYYAVVPHPSPVNAFWNDRDNVARARLFFDKSFGRVSA